jgi:hypothetical protein
VAIVALVIAGLSFYFALNYSSPPNEASRTAAAPGSRSANRNQAVPGTGRANDLPPASPDVPDGTEHLTFTPGITFNRYLTNADAGSILIISGRVDNGFPDRRSHIRLKAFLKDSGGAVTAEREAFAGNYLTDIELTTLPVNEIQAVLSRPDGQDGSNTNVVPGSSIPFMLVFDSLPPDLAEYAVEIMGSETAGPQPGASSTDSVPPAS